MIGLRARRAWLALIILMAVLPNPAAALSEQVLERVVSVLPVWSGQAQGGNGASPGTAPEGSGVLIRPNGVIATAAHVVSRARSIDVRLSDGRVLAARLIAADPASDLALLKIEAELPAFELAPRPALAAPVCAIGNAFGLGLSVTCGVVSARDVSNAGFNPVEDFVQTDAASNPGMSGGALVTEDGRLAGMMSAIFASDGDGDIGVNFAVSAALLERVAAALLADGVVDYPNPGWRLAFPSQDQRAEIVGAVVLATEPGGAAETAGVLAGDIVTRIGERRIRKPRDTIAALAILPPTEASVEATLLRDGSERRVLLALAELDADQNVSEPAANQPEETRDCPHPEPVCLVRQAVFPISGFFPVASATRIGPSLLVTNRHNVADQTNVTVFTPEGPREGVVIASAYTGDLALIALEGLPEDGLVLAPGGAAVAEPFFAVGADVGRQQVRVFEPGTLIAEPAAGAPLGRLHVTALMQPGVSGGALVNTEGALVGVATGGGEGRYEAIPVRDVQALLALRYAPDAAAVHASLGEALAACVGALDRFAGGEPGAIIDVAGDCRDARNQGQFLEAGRALARVGEIDAAIDLHSLAVEQTPNSINARISLLVSLQLGGRFPEMVPHARWVMTAAPEDPGALRFAIQSGVWGDDLALAEEGYQKLLSADPRQAQAARRFIDSAPPAPPRR